MMRSTQKREKKRQTMKNGNKIRKQQKIRGTPDANERTKHTIAEIFPF